MNGNPDLCPRAVKVALDCYSRDGLPIGGFILAVLSNDLLAACKSADEENAVALQHIVAYAYWNVPAEACGSREAVSRWLAKDWAWRKIPRTCNCCPPVE